MNKIVNYLVQLHLIYFGVILSFDYNLQSKRGGGGLEFPECSGDKQSPININTRKTIQGYFPAIEFVGYNNLIRGDSYFRNDGKTVLLQIGANEDKPYIFGGKLPGIFDFETFHFHWGSTSDRGSEHNVDNVRYSMEMHLVHRNQKYESLVEAREHPDGIAVIGVFLDEEYRDNDELDTLIEHVAQLKQFNSTIKVQSPIELAWYLPFDVDRFFTYEGSLTTPPCSEAVTWIVYSETVGISHRQLNFFRNLQTENRRQLVDNFRRLQPLNERPVYERNFVTRNPFERSHHKNLILDK